MSLQENTNELQTLLDMAQALPAAVLDAVRYGKQTLTEAQKAQARQNIDTVSRNGLSLGRHGNGLLYLYIDGVPVGDGVELPTGGIDGYITQDKQIIFNNLPDGEYTLAYVEDDGTIVPIGSMEKDTNVYYSIINKLTNCTSNNSATQVVQGSAYSATITAKSGYELKSVSATMGGTAVSVSNGKINIANVTGNIVITAVAEVSGPAYTNQIPLSTDASGNPYNSGTGWKTGYRLNSSGAEVSASGVEVTGFIPFRLNDTLYLKNITDDGSHNIALYDASYVKLATMTFATPFGGAVNGNYVYKKFTPTLHTQIEQAGDNIRFLRLCANEITANSIITVNEAIT